MATIMTKRGQLDNVVTYEHICDTVADMANINPSYVTLGSVCIVIKGENDDLEVYMADSTKEWKSISSSSGESGGGSSSGIHICAQDEYDSVTGMPTIEDPLSNTFYLTPGGDETNDLYSEWIWLEEDEEWEKFGTAASGVSDVQVNGVSVVTDGVANVSMEKLASGFPDVLPMDVLYNKLWYASDDAYCILQGACVVDDSLYACFSASGNDTSIKLRVFDISTFNVLNTATLNINHGNSIAYKDGKLYIIGADNKIHIVNLSSLSIETTKSVDYLPVGVCVNASGNLIVVRQGLSIIEYSLPDLEVIKTYDTPYTELKHGVNQYDIEYCDGYYYAVMSGPTSIYVYDDDFELVKCIDIKERYDRITLRETEFVTYMGNGEFMIGWNTVLLPSSRITSYPVVEQVTFTKTNFKKGNSNNKEQNVEDAYSPNAIVPIYVNKAYADNYSDGSWQYPYREVQQAIDNVNIESALYDIRIKPGTYLPVYAINKQAFFSTWPNQQTAERLQDVTINSIFLINSSFNIGAVKLTEHAATDNYALRVDMNSFCVTTRGASDPEYKVITTLGGIYEARDYFHNVTQNGGMYLFNSNSKRTWDYNKNLANGKIFGRAGMYTGDSRDKTVTVSHGHLDIYVFVIASITIEGHMFKGLIESNVKNDIPFEYYDSGNRIYGVVELTTTRTDIQTTLTCYKGSAAYTPSSFNLLVEGAI